MIHRRSFITGLISLVAAPAIVRAGSLMPFRGEVMVPDFSMPHNTVFDFSSSRLFLTPCTDRCAHTQKWLTDRLAALNEMSCEALAP